MDLIKYRDEQNGERNYSWFWTHRFVDTDHAVVVSPIFSTEAEALAWGRNIRDQMLAGKTAA